MSKRNKKYNPNKHRIDSTIGLRIIQNVKPLEAKDRESLWKQAFIAINTIQFAQDVTRNDFTLLCDMLNISMLLASRGIGDEHKQDLYAARDAMQETKEKFMETGRLRFYGQGIEQMRQALEIHRAQLSICTFGEFVAAYDEQNARIAKGDYYKASVENEKRAA